MSANNLPSEVIAVVAKVDPDANAVGAVTSDWADAGKFEAMLAVVSVGAIAATQTLDAKLQQATDASGTGAKDISGKAITQLGGSDDDKQAVINVRASELDMDNGYRYVALVMTGADSASPDGTIDYDGVLLGFYPRFGPASDNDLASVAEIVT